MRSLAVLFLIACCRPALAEEPQVTAPNINTAMMESTFQILGTSAEPGKLVNGTGFIVGRPDKNNAQALHFTLITANHVLNDCQGDDAVLVGRKRKDGSPDEWEPYKHSIKIRSGGTPTWTTIPDVDLAGMYVSIPNGTLKDCVPMGLLLTDEDIREFELGPGTELLCLGYPLGVMSGPAFPVLRSGKIASYPLLPTDKVKAFLFDFNVFPGNSGGPVYLYQTNPVYGGNTHIGAIHGLVGVVTAQVQNIDVAKQVTSLGLGHVIPAPFIRKLMEAMPEPTGTIVAPTSGSVEESGAKKPESELKVGPTTEQE